MPRASGALRIGEPIHMVEAAEPYSNLLSEPKYIRKPCLFNTLLHTKSLQPAGLREKFKSLHFPETENGRGFDSRSEASYKYSAKLNLKESMSRYSGVICRNTI